MKEMKTRLILLAIGAGLIGWAASVPFTSTVTDLSIPAAMA